MSLLKIPRKDVIELIKLCFENISQFLLDAKLIHSQKSRFDHSVALIQFAVEELGKASILQKRLHATKNNLIDVPDNLFGGRGSHQLKEKEAWTVLSNNLRVLAEGAFDPRYFDPRYFVTEDVELTHEERLRCLFVDFKNGAPTLGVACESQKLEKIIESIDKEIVELKKSWV